VVCRPRADRAGAGGVRRPSPSYGRFELPFWPLGLPGWHDDWLALGIRTDEETLLALWRRGGLTRRGIPLEASTTSAAELVYPPFPTRSDWGDGILTVDLPDEPSARLFRLGRA
jgi:alpha-galactosidase